MNIHIDEMKLSDREEVLDIYRMGIETGLATFETEVPAWEQWDAGHLTHCRLAARVKDQLVAWAALSPVSKRKVYAGVAEVSIYVHQAWRGQGIGAALLAALIQCSEAAGIWTLQASIFPENTASIGLHAKAGFRIVGYREKIAQLHGVWRDTLWMERRSGSFSSN